MSRIAKVPSRLGDLQFECIISRSAEYSATIPQYAVESGSYTSDTILREPLQMSLEVFVSEMLVSHKETLGEVTTDEYGNAKSNGTAPGRVMEVKEKLLAMMKSGELFTLTTPETSYPNMGITNVSCPEDDWVNAMQISISLKQVTLTTPQTVCAESYEYSGQTEEPTGTIGTEEITETEFSETVSTAIKEYTEEHSTMESGYLSGLNQLVNELFCEYYA